VQSNCERRQGEKEIKKKEKWALKFENLRERESVCVCNGEKRKRCGGRGQKGWINGGKVEGRGVGEEKGRA